MKKALLAGLCSLAAVAGSLAIVSACSKGNVSELSFDPNNMPQINFVQGNDLNLSGARLIADGSIVGMDSDDVQITGYDKNKLGAQTLKVTYGGKTIDFNITVVPRFQTAAKPVYFVGDEFADAAPVITVWNDNGTSTTLSGDYSTLTVTNFSTATANENLELQLTYTSGDAAYTGSFAVEVCTPVYTFTPPSDRDYGSHEGELNLSGCMLTVSNGKGYNRYADISKDVTFDGVDFDAVDEDNPSETQTVEVLYKGRDTGKSFDITMTYSVVSQILDFAVDCPAPDEWETPSDWAPDESIDYPVMYMPDGVTDEVGEKALELLQEYEKLPLADRNYISQSVLEDVGRVGVIYGYNKWFETYYGDDDLTNAVIVDNSGYAVYVSASDEAPGQGTVTAYEKAAEKLLNANGADKTVNELERISGIFAGEIVRDKLSDTNVYADGNSPMDSIFRWYIKDHAYLQSMAKTLGDAVEAYKLLADITTPAADKHTEWMGEDMRNTLTTNAEDIESAYKALKNISDTMLYDQSMPVEDDAVPENPYIPYVFMAINGFAEKEDYFEILYRYYYYRMLYTADLGDDEIEDCQSAISNLSSFYLPTPLNGLLESFQMAELYRQVLIQNAEMFIEDGTDSLSEATIFMVQFNDAQKLLQEFLDTYIDTEVPDTLYTYLYINLGFGSAYSTLYYGDFGYTDLLGSASYDDTVLGLWTKYIDLYLAYLEDDTLLDSANSNEDAIAFRNGVKEMFNAFAALDAAQQYRFITSLNYLYATPSDATGTGSPVTALFPDTEDGSLGSLFAQFIYTCYYSEFNENSGDEFAPSEETFNWLMLAIESFANGDTNAFCYYMELANEVYEGSWDNFECTKEKFDELLGSVYEKNLELYRMFDKTGEGDDAVFEYNGEITEEDETTLAELDRILYNAEMSHSALMDLEMTYLVSFEQARRIVDGITPDSTLDKALHNMRYNEDLPLYHRYYDLLGNAKVFLEELELTYDVYMSDELAGMRDFMNEYADYYYLATEKYVNSKVTNPTEQVFYMYSGYVEGDSESNKAPELTSEYVSGMLTKLVALELDPLTALLSIDADAIFFNGLQLGIEFTPAAEGEVALDDLMISLQNAFIRSLTYKLDPDAVADETQTTAELFVETYESYKADLDKLSAERKEEFESYFEPLMTTTKAAYEEAKASIEESGSTDDTEQDAQQ